MKHILATVAIALACTHANAQQSSAHGMRAGLHGGGSSSAGQSAASAGSTGGNSGMGGSYYASHYLQNTVDNYQPWPQSEMQQYAKANFTPYGE